LEKREIFENKIEEETETKEGKKNRFSSRIIACRLQSATQPSLTTTKTEEGREKKERKKTRGEV
jgi:hypothetical protein